jgi:hypothetical protein
MKQATMPRGANYSTYVPLHDTSINPASEVITYTLSPEELAKYQAMPSKPYKRPTLSLRGEWK